MLRISLLLITVCCCLNFSNAQSIRLVVNNSNGTAQLKWFTNTLLAKEGVNVYRQSSDGSWTKLNNAPIRKGEYTPTAAELSADTELKDHLDLLRTTKPLESFGLLLASLKAVRSTPFAKAAGLYYVDQQSSNATGYKVALIVNGIETAFAEYLFAAHEGDNKELLDIQYEQRFKKVQFGWTVEENKYYAVNIYRSGSIDSIGQLVNPEPIIPSKVKSAEGVEEYPKWFLEDRLVREKSTYYYRLVGIDFFNREMQMSAPITIRIKDETAPVPPVLKSKDEQQPAGFIIHWEQPEKSDDMIGYEIYLTNRNDTIYNFASSISGTDSTQFFVELSKVGTYSVMVASKDAEGNLGYSNELVLDFLDKTPPMKPTNVLLNTDSTLITVTWDANTDPDILGYKIYRGINGDLKSMALQSSIAFAENKYVDKLPKNSKNSFSYYVIAVDSALNESVMSDVASKKLVDVVPPKAPFIKNIELQEKGALVSWSKNTEIDLMKYEIYRKDKADSLTGFKQLNLTNLDKNSAAFLDRSFQKGKEFVYVIYAFDSLGNKSHPSNEFKFFAPKEKEKLDLVCKFKKPKIAKATSNVRLSWEIKPYTENVKYMVFRKTEGGAYLPLSGILESNRYTDQTAEKGVHYFYEIRCYLEDGSYVKSEQQEVLNIKEPKK